MSSDRLRADYSPAARSGVVTLRTNACGFLVEGRFGIELNINSVEMALVEFPPLDGTRPWNWYGLAGVELPLTRHQPFDYQVLSGLMKVW
jgi:hypothetical protein